MNKAQFINYLETPDKLTLADGVAIAGLLKDFPFFQTAHLLYAKALHNHNDIHYNNQLKIAAAYAADRSMLHKLITKQSDKSLGKEFVISSPKALITKETAIEIAVQELVKEEVLEKKIIAEVGTPVLENVGAIEEINISSEIGISLEEKNKEQFEPIDSVGAELEKEYLNEILNETLVYDLLSVEPPEKVDVIYEKVVIEKDKIISEVISSSEKESTTVDEESLNFTDWLKYIDSGKDVRVPHESEMNTKMAETTELDAFALIDKFIKEEPRIAKPKVEFYNPVNFAKQSVEDDISLVTETLAKIFLQQGNYAKALSAYENLYLKYPEKKLYFAAQIKKIKKIINSQNQ